MTPPKRTIFISNKELLAEIHRCKVSFCSFTDERYAQHDAIVRDLAEVTDAFLEETCERRSKELSKKGQPPVEVVPHGLIIRMMTFEHIPLDPDRKRKSRQKNTEYAYVSFPPFKHYLLEVDERGARTFTEVGRSHWEGGLENGWFNAQKGRVTNRMGRMYMELVDRYGRKANWRNYSYLQEMKSQALLQLSQSGLLFDEAKSANPFAFYTTIMMHCFTRVWNQEKKVQDIRDDMLIMGGAAPSMTRQIDYELKQMGLIEPPKIAGKRGRPKKSA